MFRIKTSDTRDAQKAQTATENGNRRGGGQKTEENQFQRQQPQVSSLQPPVSNLESRVQLMLLTFQTSFCQLV